MGVRPGPGHGVRGPVLPSGQRGRALRTTAPTSAGKLDSPASAAKAGLLEALLTLATATSSGRLHPRAAPYLCAARLNSQRKKYGWVRPIAVGHGLRRLVTQWLLASAQGRNAALSLHDAVGAASLPARPPACWPGGYLVDPGVQQDDPLGHVPSSKKSGFVCQSRYII